MEVLALKALRLQEFVKLMQTSLGEDDPIIFDDTAKYIVNRYGDEYEEEVNTGDYVLVTQNKLKVKDLQESSPD